MKTLIVVFGFGRPDICSNKLLKMVTIKRIKRMELEGKEVLVVTQRDINLDKLVAEARVEVVYVDEKGKAPSTYKIVKKAVEILKKNGLSELLIVAARPHIKRILRDFRKVLEKERIKIPMRVAEEVFLAPEEVWFSQRSSQIHTRVKWIWKIREFILMKLPFWLYKKLSGS